MKVLFTVLFSIVLFTTSVFSNNVQISNATLTGQSAVTHSFQIQFNMSWDNNWRDLTNHDAVWLFAKYKKLSDGQWYHCTLSSTASEHSVGTPAGGTACYTVTSDGKGVYYQRLANGAGTFTTTAAQIRWNYGSDGLTDAIGSQVTDVKVFAIEMVYIPQGSFVLGSGGTEIDHFYAHPTTTSSYTVSSEAAINVGTTAGYLYYTTTDAAGDQTGPVPANFPKGYNGFYCMKYEISQEQYMDFLNTLTYDQQVTRTAAAPSSAARTLALTTTGNEYRNGIRIVTAGTASTTPAVYGCDLGNNGTFNESDDGQNIACNFLSADDGLAYADWSGLRPLTELEFEKICRGTIYPSPNDYAWSNTNIYGLLTVSNSGMATEAVLTPASPRANCNYNNSVPLNGPCRVGIFPSTGTNREEAGAGYYGVMDLSGNVWERCVTIGTANGRTFTGVAGDGTLATNGSANTTNWPTNTSVYFRGGCFTSTSAYVQVSNRGDGGIGDYTVRANGFGFRCVR